MTSGGLRKPKALSPSGMRAQVHGDRSVTWEHPGPGTQNPWLSMGREEEPTARSLRQEKTPGPLAPPWVDKHAKRNQP